MTRVLEGELDDRAAALDAGAAYDEHAEFAYQSLHRLGVRTADLSDLLQDVFLVVHRRRTEHDGQRPVRGWIWGICVGIARNHRRRAWRRNESLPGEVPEIRADADPERELDDRRRRARGQRALEELDPEKRAVFVMFEVEGMSGREIAELLDVPIGTVHSRLHGARKELAMALAGSEDA